MFMSFSFYSWVTCKRLDCVASCPPQIPTSFADPFMKYRFIRRQLTCLFATIVLCSAGSAAADESQSEVFQSEVKPLLRRYCIRCHGGKTTEAKIHVGEIDSDVVHGAHFDQWEDIREAFNSGEMPPEDQPQPTAAHRDTITRWLDVEFKKAKQLGSSKRRGGVRRLTRYELQYALEDLLHTSVEQDITGLPEEATSVETGLKNSSQLLMISGPHLESYLDLIVSVTNKIKEIAAFEPYTETIDIEKLDTNPPQALTRDGKKFKPTVLNIERNGKGVVIAPRGYIDLQIPTISEYKFQTLLTAKADGPGEFLVSIGFTRSAVDPRQILAELGVIAIEQSEELRNYSLDSFPETLPAEMTRALDRPFFIRLTNRSKKGIYVRTYDYKGNVNVDLTETLVPAGIAPSDLDGHIRQSVRTFLEKAFRRSPTIADLDKYYAIYLGYALNEKPLSALVSTYKEILCSPSFFYLGIPGDLFGKARQNYKVAERLAFFLWCSVPDDLLLKAASQGQLTTPSVLASHVERMLEDEKSLRWVEQFSDQWLQTSKLFNVAVDKNYYPNFKEPMKELMRRETIEAVNDVFRNGASAIDLLDADHLFVNQALSSYYQMTKRVRGDEFRKVPIDEDRNRGGLLTQGTFLIGNSDGMNSHAILRGVWLSEVILNDPPPDPPKNVPALDESIPGFDQMTLNEKLFAHRDNDACKSCHQKIDPWGIPFENYDASGLWRDKVLVVSKETVQTEVPGRKKKRQKTVLNKSLDAIDRQATLPGNVAVNGVRELKEYLVKHRRNDFARGLTERILAYALSRDIDYHDEDLVDQLVDRFEANNYSVPTLIRDIVQSEPFLPARSGSE